jgi:hypothetical protein
MNPQTTGVLAATGGAAAVAESCFFIGAVFDHTAAADCIITITTGGAEICTLRLVGTLAGSGTVSFMLPFPIYCAGGITYNITTGGGVSIIFSK